MIVGKRGKDSRSNMLTFFREVKNIFPDELQSSDGWFGQFSVETLPTTLTLIKVKECSL